VGLVKPRDKNVLLETLSNYSEPTDDELLAKVTEQVNLEHIVDLVRQDIEQTRAIVAQVRADKVSEQDTEKQEKIILPRLELIRKGANFGSFHTIVVLAEDEKYHIAGTTNGYVETFNKETGDLVSNMAKIGGIEIQGTESDIVGQASLYGARSTLAILRETGQLQASNGHIHTSELDIAIGYFAKTINWPRQN